MEQQLARIGLGKDKTIVQIGDLQIGGDEIVLIAGPCAIESEDQLIQSGIALKNSGVSILRASAFKPRTSPYSFQGLGVSGLKMHKKAKEHHGLLTTTEVMDVRLVETVSEYVDVIWIGARNMQNFDLLKEVGKSQRPVILKRSASATVEEWIQSAEYIMAHGNPNVILCERGIRTFENSTRYTLDLSAVAVAKQLTHLPIIVDPSHAAGRTDIIAALCRAAVAVGADGLIVEAHPNPKESVCDAKQALSFEQFDQIASELKPLAQAVGRRLSC